MQRPSYTGAIALQSRLAARDDEQARRRSELRYRRVFETSRDGILILDADSGRIIDVNPYLVELLGQHLDALVGQRIWDVEALREVIASPAACDILHVVGSVTHDDRVLETGDGRLLDVSIVSTVYLEGETRTIQCNVRDISLRVRTAADLEDQLRAAQKLESLGGLAGGIAHDFNNLLSVILVYTELACEALPPDSPIRDNLLEVVTASKSAAELTQRLLDFGRKHARCPGPVDVNQVLDSLEKMLRRILGSDIELITRLEPALGTAIADPSQLEQIVMNLVVNARDAMPDGGQLTLETANVQLDAEYASRYLSARPGPYVMLAISDTGVGMDAATMDRVFEPFFTTKSPEHGTGLGLAIVHGIVRQSGGSLRVSSTVGRGTTFAIYLPRTPA